MAPLTRCMVDENLVPTSTMAEYYGRRAEAGLIISEATIIRPDAQGYPNTPGLFTPQQIKGWKLVPRQYITRVAKYSCRYGIPVV